MDDNGNIIVYEIEYHPMDPKLKFLSLFTKTWRKHVPNKHNESKKDDNEKKKKRKKKHQTIVHEKVTNGHHHKSGPDHSDPPHQQSPGTKESLSTPNTKMNPNHGRPQPPHGGIISNPNNNRRRLTILPELNAA